MILARSISSELLYNAFKPRPILCAFHDIDGTHSLIRDWPPVMSIVLHTVIHEGLPEEFDSEKSCLRLISLAGRQALPETDRFCMESAGLSALTQMEWAIRRAVEEGNISVNCDRALNAEKIKMIWEGRELFSDLPETNEMQALLSSKTPRLFRFYEQVLNGYCRDRNLAEARRDPSRFLVPGSMDFLKYLHQNGVVNYFVTGAVVEAGMGMFEEVQALGYQMGPGRMIEALIGSTWNEKLPKEIIMARLREQLGIQGENVLVIGDGRSEISAGVKMGAVTLSRLPKSADTQRKLHISLGTNLIVEDFLSRELYAALSTQA